MRTFIIMLFLIPSTIAFAQMGIGTNVPAASLDIVSNTMGFLIPRFADHTSLTASLGPDQQGMQVYNTTTNSIWCWSGTSWSECGTPSNYISFFVDVSGDISPTTYTSTLTNYDVLTVNRDVTGAYNTTTGFITLPTDGLYQITATMRIRDSSNPNTIFGIGVHTATADGPWFQRHLTQNTTVGTRRSSFPYVRIARFNAGDQLRMFVNVEGAIPRQMQRAGLQILKISN